MAFIGQPRGDRADSGIASIASRTKVGTSLEPSASLQTLRELWRQNFVLRYQRFSWWAHKDSNLGPASSADTATPCGHHRPACFSGEANGHRAGLVSETSFSVNAPSENIAGSRIRTRPLHSRYISAVPTPQTSGNLSLLVGVADQLRPVHQDRLTRLKSCGLTGMSSGNGARTWWRLSRQRRGKSWRLSLAVSLGNSRSLDCQSSGGFPLGYQTRDRGPSLA